MAGGRTIASVIAGVLVAATVALGAGPARATGRPNVPDEPQPTAFLVADADTGVIIAARNEHQALPPSSALKLVTALVGLEKMPIETILSVSALDARQPSPTIDMQEGQNWPMTDALHALLMASANDAAFAIAENASGSVAQFSADMQAGGRRWGLADSTLDNPAGLDTQGSPKNVMSAYDLAIIGRNALSVPAIADVAKLAQYQFTDPTGSARTVTNQNNTWLSGYEGATGLKPGSSDGASNALVASATRGGRTCVAVVLGSSDINGWAARLNDQCFSTPVAQGKGSTQLPPVRVATVDGRRDAVSGFPRALGAPAFASATRGKRQAPNGVAGKRAQRGTAKGNSPNRDTKAGAKNSGGGSAFTLRNLLLVGLVLLITFVLLRRRAVKRRRQRRVARQRLLADARRRGVLHVLEPESTGEVSHVTVVPGDGRRPRR